ncbi:uncharacterized protein LOC132549914 [Ylistrum balloti]|uniref:uncharacterized protein LOC132549914 n=1 Tax=Ylistrum balloti TaxID=509963 RepID=UPI002905A57A|nr:uncharacterized protein LOC132549914 [Ylistrum balloti]
MTKSLHTVCASFRNISGVTNIFSFNQTYLGHERHVTIKNLINTFVPVNWHRVHRGDIIWYHRNHSIPINTVEVVHGHRHEELTKYHIRYFSTASASSEEYDNMDWEKKVDYRRLSPKEQKIHDCHKRAVMEQEELYQDPYADKWVMTRYAHLKRGKCCGSACRHCPYQHRKVTDDTKEMICNSAFYVKRGDFQDT